MSDSMTRMIALGSAPLMEGFALLGFEIFPDANEETLDRVLEQLLRDQERALVLLEQNLARSNSTWLSRVRNEGGNIVITELPSLHEPENYHPPVEDLVVSILGASALDEHR